MKSNEEGSTIIEMGVSCGVLFATLIGAFQISLMLYCYHFLSYAAREGARYAIVRGSNSCYQPGVTTSHILPCNDSTGTATVSYVQSLRFPGIDWTRCKPTGAATCVTVTFPASGGTNNYGDPVQVHITYPYTLMLPWVKPISITMSSTSQMIITN